MPYRIIKRIKLIHKGTSVHMPVFGVDLDDERTWRLFKLHIQPAPDIQGEVVRIFNPDGTTRDTIKRSYIFPTSTTCHYTNGTNTVEKRLLYMPNELVQAFGIDENMGIELILKVVINHYAGYNEEVSIYERMVQGPQELVAMDDLKVKIDFGNNEPIKNQSKTLFEVVEKAHDLGLDINWVISVISLQLQEIAVLKCAERAKIKLDKNHLQQALNRTIREEVSKYLSFKDQYDLLSFEIEKQRQIRLPQLAGDLRAMRVRVLHQGYNPEPIETQAIAKFSVDLLDKLKGIA